jgi:hypothetical protein
MLRRLLLLMVFVPGLCFCGVGIVLMPRISRNIAEHYANGAQQLVAQAADNDVRATEIATGNVDGIVNEIITARRQASTEYQNVLWVMLFGTLCGATLLIGAILYRILHGHVRQVNAEYEQATREFNQAAIYRSTWVPAPPIRPVAGGTRRLSPFSQRYRAPK